MTAGRQPRPPLFVVTSRNRRGGEVAASVLAGGLIDRGTLVELVALTAEGVGLDVPALGRSALSIEALRGLRGLMRDGRIVVGFGSSTLPACAAAGILANSSFVYRSIGDPLYWCNTASRRQRTALALRRARRVVALWNGAATSLRDVLGVPAHRLTTIPNGVDDARFTPADEARRLAARYRFGLRPDVLTLLYMGSLSPEKRVGLAIDAVARLDDTQLLIAGDGPLRASVEAAATSLLGERCRLAGVVPAEVALAAADVLVLPSATEGMPAVVLEAAFAGVPAVATDVGALSEIVCDGQTGQLVPVEAGVTALASALRAVLDSAPSLGVAARAHCTGRYDLATVTDSWTALLHELATS